MKKLFAFLLFLFITQIAMANDIVCDDSGIAYFAAYESNTYNCSSGYYLPANTLGCKPCPSGFTCPGGTFQFNPDKFQGLEFRDNITATMNNVCAANFPNIISAIYEANKHDCATGFYMPANTDGCRPCLYGRYCAGGTYTFNTDNDQGIIIGSYVCNSGYFLPANAAKCKPCPSGVYCPGGTFQFNPDMFQGLYFTENITTATMNNVCAANFPTNIFAIYTPNVHDCATGFYMPANMDGCVQCPENNYCAGGTYTFNETITQGITTCPDLYPYAPVGMWDENQCGRKLYVGGEYLYVHRSPANPTEHRLYIKFGDNVYSANATPIDSNPNIKMSANAQRSLHVKIDGIEYLIHDDSVK